ncbi:hypothetical protein [Chelativorans sp.]|uniref:hypothetical protein n=1 Tax=Chelativorans sp. TaxID=2203393 RepID=UPI002812601D|nr:hypothetical protein [Chelativorans sp.]
MITLNAFLNDDDTQVALQFPELNDATVTLTRDDLDEFIAVLGNIRERMQPSDAQPPQNQLHS